MVDASTGNALLQYGALGAIAVVFLAIVSFGFRTILSRFLKAFDQLVQTLTELNKDMEVHATLMVEQHRQTMLSLHQQNVLMNEKLEQMRRDSRERKNTRP